MFFLGHRTQHKHTYIQCTYAKPKCNSYITNSGIIVTTTKQPRNTHAYIYLLCTSIKSETNHSNAATIRINKSNTRHTTIQNNTQWNTNTHTQTQIQSNDHNKTTQSKTHDNRTSIYKYVRKKQTYKQTHATILSTTEITQQQ